MPLISVITPASRGVEHLSHLLRDFKNQTFQDFEHCIIWDGDPPESVINFIKDHQTDYNIRFVPIKKDLGDMRIAPGTRPRNYGVSIAKGEYVVFADDDDRYKSTYLETLLWPMAENTVTVVQMSCQESRMYKNGDPKRIVLVPEAGLSTFPQVCHVGTPCFMVPRKWALENPWQHETEHDFRFIARIVQKYNPQIVIKFGMQVDVDGLVIKDLSDWVTTPPFYRD